MTHNTPSMEQLEAHAFRRQQIAFCVLTLFVIAVLLLLHVLFSSLLGEPSIAVILLLGASFAIKLFESIWLQGRHDGISERSARFETALSIGGIFVLAALLAFLTDRDDAPYFVLLAIPILQSAYHFGLLPTALTVVSASGMIFAWIHHYSDSHPPAHPTEYLEAGVISTIFALMGFLVWFLVHQLREQQTLLYENLAELNATREKLIFEEKLAAVGRLASGIAHEIRNPVAMIASSLDTANDPGLERKEREEMFAIAAREAKRLENLTTDFLTYARPSDPQYSEVAIGDILHHIVDVTRMRAADRSITVGCQSDDEILAEIDALQVEGALLNLSLNALDAAADHGRIELKAWVKGGLLHVEVANSGKSIPDSLLTRIFEPFFTTKQTGTGLGLAIARGVAIAHGGELWVSRNEDGVVAFTMTLPVHALHAANHALREPSYGEGINR